MPSEAMGEPVDSMSESMTPHEAARVLARASTYEDALVQRTEGLTAMVWGICTSALFLTYGFGSVLGAPRWAYGLFWIPWVAAGMIFTLALWRSAALSRPAGAAFERPTRVIVRFLLVTLAFSAIFFFVRPDGPVVPLAIVGGVWTLMAMANVYQSSPRGRILWAATGMSLVVGAALLAAFRAPIEVSGLVSILLPGIIPMALGLYQTLRG